MPVFGLDISHHQDLALDLARCKREGIEFVFLKATEGSAFVDSEFAVNLAEARNAGQLVAAYHYVRSNVGAAAQVAHIQRVIPRDVPVIPDVEANSGAIGLTRDFVARLKAAGYTVPFTYLPRWYWQQIGSPSLAGLPPLWSSRYPDNVVGTIADEWADVPASYWVGYGGLDVAVLQFTSSARIAGHQPLDANAYRGTRAQLSALLGGGVEDDVSFEDETFPHTLADGRVVQISYGSAIQNMFEWWFYGSQTEPWKGPAGVAHLKGLTARPAVVGADVDVPALAAELAPLLPDVLVQLPDVEVARLAKAFGDEVDRRARDNDPATGPTS